MEITNLGLFLALFLYLGLPIHVIVSLIKIVDWQVEQISCRKLRYRYYEK